MRIICGNAHPELGAAICRHAGVEAVRADIALFPDGETKVRILDDVRGLDIFIIQPTSPPVNERLMELLIICDALRRASAKSITAVVPYFGYARQDRKHAGRVPITAKLVGNLITVAGVNRLLTIDLHAPQIQGFFDIPVDHLEACPVLIDHIRTRPIEDPVAMSPDIGSIKMADAFARRLGAGIAVVEKRRVSDSETEAGYVIGDIKGRDVLIIDDMITSGGSMAGAVRAARNHGARSVRVVATHGLFAGPAFERLRAAGATEVVVTDTTPQSGRKPEGLDFSVASVSGLLAEAIGRIHRNRSVSLLFS